MCILQQIKTMLFNFGDKMYQSVEVGRKVKIEVLCSFEFKNKYVKDKNFENKFSFFKRRLMVFF
jgi:hypothetical protein